MEGDLKKKEKKKEDDNKNEDDLKKNGMQTNQPKTTLLAVTPL